MTQEFWNSAWKFAFVRNPYARAVSLFKYLTRIELLPPKTTFRIFCAFLKERAFEPIGLYNRRGLSMLNPQVTWRTDETGHLLPDYFSKVKDATAGYAKIVEVLKVRDAPPALPRLNASPDAAVASYYDAETQAIVADVYQQDFSTFDFDPAVLPA